MRWRHRIVIALGLGVGLGLAFPPLVDGRPRKNVGLAVADTRNLAKAIARMRQDTGTTSVACLKELRNLTAVNAPAVCGAVPLCATTTPGQPCWGGPYLRGLRNDPWDQPYRVRIDEETHEATVRSIGSDGEAGTRDDVTYTE